jgi:TrmH family RNA methyltransferase
MKTRKISTKNAAFQIFSALKHNRSKRKQYKQIIVEGIIPINLCIRSRIPIEAILVEEGKRLSKWAHAILSTVDCEYLYRLAPPLMAGLSDKDERSELLLVAEYPETDLTLFTPGHLKRIVVLDRPSSPGNMGAIIRTCDAFQIDAVLLSGHGVDPYDPKTITASRGTIFTVPLIQIASNARLEALIGQLKHTQHHFCVYGSSGKYGTNLHEMPLAEHFCLIIGNETYGMNDFLKYLSDEVITIGMHGAASSLNAACATSIMLYELTKLSFFPI